MSGPYDPFGPTIGPGQIGPGGPGGSGAPSGPGGYGGGPGGYGGGGPGGYGGGPGGPGWGPGSGGAASGGGGKKGLLIGLIAVVVVLLIAGGVTAAVLLTGDDGSNFESSGGSDRSDDPTEEPTDEPTEEPTEEEPTEEEPTADEPTAETPMVPPTDQPNPSGSDPLLDVFQSFCLEGDPFACDLLYDSAPAGSEYEQVGASCGNRSAENATCLEQAGASPPFTDGDSALLDALGADCVLSGFNESCDVLYLVSPVGSEYETAGALCGGRSQEPLNGNCFAQLG